MLSIENLTRTVASFEPTAERFENTQTGRVMTAGVIAFEECGHSYEWRPWGLQDHEPMPAAGAQMMCANCIEAAIAEAQPAAQS